MKKRILTQIVLLLLVAAMCLLSACNTEPVSGERGEKGDTGATGATGNGIASITTEKVDGGTKVIIKYTDPSVADTEFIIPDGEKGEQGIQGEKGDDGEKGDKGDKGDNGDNGEAGRGILKTEIIDGCLWITFTDDPENPVNVGRVTPEETTTPEEEDPEFPETVDLGGYTYKAYVRSNYESEDPGADGNPQFYCEDFWVNPDDGEPEDAISFAVYQRNNKIQTDYNVSIQQVPQSGNMTDELSYFSAIGRKFDLTIILAKSAAQAATYGLLRDLNAMDTLDLRYPSYDQSSIKELSMGNKLYYLSGDMNISTLDNVTATIANLGLYKQYADDFVELFGDSKYENLYNLVSSKSWTMDTLLLMAEYVTTDVSGDAFGYFQYANAAMYYFYGAGGRITKIAESGYPELIVGQSENEMIFNYIYDNFNTNNSSFWIPNGYSQARLNSFVFDGNTLFTDMTLWDVRRSIYADAMFEYGVLPIPTYNAGDDYHSLVAFSNCAHLWAIPKTVGDVENAQIMMQAMAAYSDANIEGSTMDAYYTRTLCFAAAKNSSREVMDIIKNSMIYDIAVLYDWGSWIYILENMDTVTYNYYYDMTSDEYMEIVKDQIARTIIDFGFAD